MIAKGSVGRVLLVLAFLGFSLGVNANNGIKLTDSSRVSLLTCSAGNELYSTFGHSAIRVSDPRLRFDIVFNYGTFNFEDPNFYPNFVQGKLKYILSCYPYRLFYKEYVTEKRSVWEQQLNINLSERQYLLDSLFVNLTEEHRYYQYDFLNDNCATRIRDVFVQAIPRKIEFDYGSFEKDKSYRQLLKPNLVNKPWAELGIDLLMGIPADKIATPWDYMFLPDYLEKAFQNVSFVTDSTRQPFAGKTKLLLHGNVDTPRFIWGSPLQSTIILLILIAMLSYREAKKGVRYLWVDRTLLIVAGLLGVLFTFLWVGTAHKSMVWNMNLLWANPFHLLFLFILSSKKLSKLVRAYVKINFVILLLLVVGWLILPQELPYAIYPFVVVLAIRFYLFYRNSKNLVS